MRYIFYADSFFLLNLGLDYLLLRITGCLWKKQITLFYIAGAFLGALLTVFTVFLRPGPVYYAAYFLISMCMCLIAFQEKRWKVFTRMWISLFLIAFFLGGMLQAFYPVTGGRTLRFLLVFLFAYACLEAMVVSKSVVPVRRKTCHDIYTVTIVHGGNEVCTEALYDSGNSLREPMSGKTVHIIDEETGKKLCFERRDTQEKIRVVPYHSLGNNAGILVAFECERLEIQAGENRIVLKNEFLGIYRGVLSGKGYHMILNRSIGKWL